MICWVCLSSLFGKIPPSIGQGMRFRLETYEGSIKQGFEKRGHATDPEPKAQFKFGHFGAALWLHTRPEIKAQFGSGHLSAVQFQFLISHSPQSLSPSNKGITSPHFPTTPLSHHLIKSILTSTQYYFNYLILTPILSLQIYFLYILQLPPFHFCGSC